MYTQSIFATLLVKYCDFEMTRVDPDGSYARLSLCFTRLWRCRPFSERAPGPGAEPGGGELGGGVLSLSFIVS